MTYPILDTKLAADITRPRAFFNLRLQGRPASTPQLPAIGLDLADWEVQGLMAGTTSALLRPIDPQPERVRVKGRRRFCWAGTLPDGSRQDVEGDAFHRFSDTCPFGKPSAALFVREAWASRARGRVFGAALHYRADGNDSFNDSSRGEYVLDPCPDREDRWRFDNWGSWREAATMPAWASRIATTLRHVEVVDMETLTPHTLAHCGPLPERPVERWCWRLDLGAIVVLEPRK